MYTLKNVEEMGIMNIKLGGLKVLYVGKTRVSVCVFIKNMSLKLRTEEHLLSS